MRWDIFCKVIDNHGDVGVCWRLCAELAARGEAVRLWIDDPSALAWMAPRGCPGVEIVHWSAQAPDLPAGDVVVEAFGCDPHEAFVAAVAARTRRRGRQPAWINLEYLSAQDYVERSHGLASPVMSGPAKGLAKRFFYPGFTARTGGLIRERDFDARRQAFDRSAWLRQHHLPEADERRVSLFCYEPPLLPELLRRLAAGPQRTRLLVTAGRAASAMAEALRHLERHHAGWNRSNRLAWSHLPLIPQAAYDELLWACDLNFVRGEDSLVRALWAGRPFVWQIYPQDDGAHHAKLDAFLEAIDAPASMRAFHVGWNGRQASLPPLDLDTWQCAAPVRPDRLHDLPELVTRLQAMAA